MQATTTIEFRESALSVFGSVARFSHQRPASRNAMTMGLRTDYSEMLDRVEADRDLRALVITGDGGSFCAGGDLKYMQRLVDSQDASFSSPDATRRRMGESQRWLSRLRSLEIPVIAAVDGPAFGAGFGLALQADFVLASSRASFCLSFARVGVIPDYGTLYLLPRLIGLMRARELVYTARTVHAPEGKELGFVNTVHEPDELLPAAHRLAERLAAGPREAFALSKRMLNQSFESDYATFSMLEANAQAICMASEYHAAAVKSFLNGQSAAFDWDK